jgi:peptide deformylase
MKLRLVNDPVLRERALEVSKDEVADILSLVPEMTKIMNNENGLGLAANQVGLLKRFFIIKDENGDIQTIFNPEIIEMDQIRQYDEGCLSIPGASAKTRRAFSLKLKYKNESFEDTEKIFTEIIAVAIQHEIDHLNGKLYIDTLTSPQKILVLKKHRDFLKRRREK